MIEASGLRLRQRFADFLDEARRALMTSAYNKERVTHGSTQGRPRATVRRMFDEYVGQEGKFSARHLILGAHRLGVSLEAFGRQLEHLELLPGGTYGSHKDRSLDERIVEQVLGSRSESDITEPGARLLMMAAEAHELEVFSEGQLADMLVMDRVELLGAIDAFTSVPLSDERRHCLRRQVHHQH